VTEALVEVLPLAAGFVLGILTFARSPWPCAAWVGAGSLVLGLVCSAVCGELSGDLLSVCGEVLFDAAAVAATWVAVHIAAHRGEAWVRRGLGPP
jgi:hypothetical protein